MSILSLTPTILKTLTRSLSQFTIPFIITQLVKTLPLHTPKRFTIRRRLPTTTSPMDIRVRRMLNRQHPTILLHTTYKVFQVQVTGFQVRAIRQPLALTTPKQLTASRIPRTHRRTTDRTNRLTQRRTQATVLHHITHRQRRWPRSTPKPKSHTNGSSQKS